MAGHFAGTNQQRLLLCGLAAAAAMTIYVPLWPAVTWDMSHFLIPWLDVILDRGPVGAFAEPFSNYTPPYLYLLALISPLAGTLGKVGLIKTLSALATGLLALAAWHLLRVAGCDRRTEGMFWLILLPTVAANVAGFGQCDALWAAACLMAVASAVQRRTIPMLLWFGLGIAFKAQAIFLAPFIAQRLLQQRAAPMLWLIPALVYLVAMAPAAIAGWPVADLLTVYLRQAAWNPEFIGNAPNPWSLVQVVAPAAGLGWLWTGQVAALAATAGFIALFRKIDGGAATIVALALLSTLVLPYLLPKMHERFFFLADVLAYLLAFIRRDRRSLMLFLLVEGASLAALAGLLLNWPLAPVVGAAMTLAAMLMLAVELRGAERPMPDAKLDDSDCIPAAT